MPDNPVLTPPLFMQFICIFLCTPTVYSSQKIRISLQNTALVRIYKFSHTVHIHEGVAMQSENVNYLPQTPDNQTGSSQISKQDTSWMCTNSQGHFYLRLKNRSCQLRSLENKH